MKSPSHIPTSTGVPLGYHLNTKDLVYVTAHGHYVRKIADGHYEVYKDNVGYASRYGTIDFSKDQDRHRVAFLRAKALAAFLEAISNMGEPR